MPIADDLRYPRRRYGMDHDRYDWSMLPNASRSRGRAARSSRSGSSCRCSGFRWT